MAATILSSLIPPTTVTWMFGCDFSKSATTDFITPSSRAVKPVQNVMSAEPDEELEPPQPAIALVSTTTTKANVARRFIRRVLLAIELENLTRRDSYTPSRGCQPGIAAD